MGSLSETRDSIEAQSIDRVYIGILLISSTIVEQNRRHYLNYYSYSEWVHERYPLVALFGVEAE